MPHVPIQSPRKKPNYYRQLLNDFYLTSRIHHEVNTSRQKKKRFSLVLLSIFCNFAITSRSYCISAKKETNFFGSALDFL